jgi:hypothetical protein
MRISAGTAALLEKEQDEERRNLIRKLLMEEESEDPLPSLGGKIIPGLQRRSRLDKRLDRDSDNEASLLRPTGKSRSFVQLHKFSALTNWVANKKRRLLK